MFFYDFISLSNRLKHRFDARDMDEVFQKLAREAQRGEHAFTHTQTEQP